MTDEYVEAFRDKHTGWKVITKDVGFVWNKTPSGAVQSLFSMG